MSAQLAFSPPDANLLAEISADPSYQKARKVVRAAAQAPSLISKLIYLLSYGSQVQVWSQEKRLSVRMSVVYLTAKEYLEASGIPKHLLDVADIMFGYLGDRRLAEPLRRSARYICVAWHARALRVFHLLFYIFCQGGHVISYGCGSGIIELLALLASGNQHAQLTLVDKDKDSIAVIHELVDLYRIGYKIGDHQVTIIHDDIRTHRPPPDTDTVVSIGLLHNYFPLAQANHLMSQWFSNGVTKVITDVNYDPAKVITYPDAVTRINFIHKVFGWKLAPQDGGLYFYSPQELANSLSDERRVLAYDQGLIATIVVS